MSGTMCNKRTWCEIPVGPGTEPHCAAKRASNKRKVRGEWRKARHELRDLFLPDSDRAA